MNGSAHFNTLPLRVRTIHGHVRAVERLIRDGRTLEALAQLRAVRAALGAMAVEMCRVHLERAEARADPRRAVISLIPLLRHRR